MRRVKRFLRVLGVMGLLCSTLVWSVEGAQEGSEAEGGSLPSLRAVMERFEAELSHFDPEAVRVYRELMRDVVRTRSVAEATTWRVPVEEGLSAEEVDQSIKMVANELNISMVGELPLSKDVEARSGKPHRFVKIYLLCDSLTAAALLAHDDAFSAYLPCRISLVEDKQGNYWLYALNMELMIHGGAPLPPELKQEALRVMEAMREILRRAAEGDF